MHRGEPLLVTLHAGWERGQYARDDLARIASKLAAFMRVRLEELGMVTA